MEEVMARLKNAPLAPYKARLVANQVRGKAVGDAMDILNFSNRKAAAIIAKLLNSAIANAEHNASLDADALSVRRIHVDDGRTLKRTRPRAKGRADRILKRSCHITIALASEA